MSPFFRAPVRQPASGFRLNGMSKQQPKFRHCNILVTVASATAALLAAACSGAEFDSAKSFELAEVEQEVIIGSTDNRADVYAATDRNLAALARRSSPAVFWAGAVDTSNPNSVQIAGTRFGDPGNQYYGPGFSGPFYDKPMCSGQRFIEQKRAAMCSASLIGEDLVLTAGHCIDEAGVPSCADARFVFGFYQDSATTMPTITADDVYKCSQVVARVNGAVNQPDYAIVRLDRKAGMRYASTRVSSAIAPIAIGAKVGVVGDPSGLPLKVTDGASVFDSGATDANGVPLVKTWYASTDTFKGNSGSAVYDTSDYTVKGIFTKTVAFDFKLSADNTCLEYETCSSASGCRQENTYAARAIEAMCKPGGTEPSNPLCGAQDLLAFNTTNTASASVDTRNHWVFAKAGQVIEASTCSSNGGTASGDTYLRLLSNEAVLLTQNDDIRPGETCSLIKYTATTAGLHELRAGCYSSNSCSGKVSIKVRDVSPYVEAECPATSVGAFSQVRTDETGYAGPGHLTAVDNNTGNTVTGSDDRATYTVWAPTAGQYDLYLRVDNDARGDRDSWFHNIDAGAWVLTNNTSGSGDGWFWYKGSSAVTLTAGKHTVEVDNRESGLSLDRIALLPVGSPAPTGAGASADNCN